MFDFNASLSDAAPMFPIPLSIDLLSREKKDFSFGIYSRFNSSSVSVVFVFNASPRAA